jgi:tetratricopeptide (TPR) repeat protein
LKPEHKNLSVCMIAKNEGAKLPTALRSVQRIADDIVVVDTGSTDDTAAVASSFGARVLSHPWGGDFSAARNVSIEAAEGSWILCLDADEYVPPDSETKILKALAGDADAYFVRLESTVDSSAGRLFVHFFPRLFRKTPGVKFEGRVHEQIFPALERAGLRVAQSDITIKHMGYSASRDEIRAKAKRNAELLARDVEANPDDALALFHLGEAHSMLEDFEQACQWYERALKAGRLPREVKAVVLQNHANSLVKLKRYDQAVAELRKAQETLPGLITVHLLMASAQFALGKFERAEKEMLAYLSKSREQKGNLGLKVSHEPDLPAAMVLLAKCKLALARISEARDVLKDAVRLDPALCDGHLLLARIAFEETRFAEAAGAYEEAVRCRPGDDRIWIDLAKAYLACGSLERAVDAASRAVSAGIRTADLLKCLGFLKIKQKDLPAAIDAYGQALAAQPGDREACRKLAGLYRVLGDDRSALAFARASETMQELATPSNSGG